MSYICSTDSIIDSPSCKTNVVNLTELETDLKKVGTTRNVNFITPNVCNDGHDAPCVNGKPGGLVSANEWLKKWVPLITESPAFKKDGLLVINFDEGGFQISTTVNGKSTTYQVSGAPDIYPVVSGDTPQTGTLELTLSPGLSAYSFTFG